MDKRIRRVDWEPKGNEKNSIALRFLKTSIVLSGVGPKKFSIGSHFIKEIIGDGHL